MILSLQGCMAVGKTTAVNYLKEAAPYVNISYESNADVIDEIKRGNLNKNKYKDYLEIQKLWLNKEIIRWEKAQAFSCSIMDFGAEEIEFYTLNYPKSIGKDWEIESRLKNELEEVGKCMPTRILFLNATEETLRKHKESDETRSRNFFEHYLKYLLPLKKQWFFGKENVDILDVDDLSLDKTGEKVKEWVDFCIRKYDATEGI